MACVTMMSVLSVNIAFAQDAPPGRMMMLRNITTLPPINTEITDIDDVSPACLSASISVKSRNPSLPASPNISAFMLRKYIADLAIVRSTDTSPTTSLMQKNNILLGSNGESPIVGSSKMDSPIVGSPTPHCSQSTIVVALPETKNAITNEVIRRARLFWGSDFSSDNDDMPIELGTINYCVNHTAKTISITSVDIFYQGDAAHKDNQNVKQDFKEKLIRFVTEQSKDLDYIIKS